MTDLSCQLATANAEASPLNVGDLFLVECSGSINITDWTPLPQMVGAKDPYVLKLMRVKKIEPNKVDLVFTSYRVGRHENLELNLKSLENEYKLKGIQFEVKSVIDANNPPKGPYGPFGPLSVALPNSYFWALGISVVFVLMVGGLFYYRRWQRRKLIDKLKHFDSAQSPYHQFQANLRKLQREYSFFSKGQWEDLQARKIVEQYDDFLRLFIIRKYWIPAHDWSDRVILRDLRKRFYNTYKAVAKDLAVYLREVSKLKKAKQAPQAADLNQMLAKLRRLIEDLEKNS